MPTKTMKLFVVSGLILMSACSRMQVVPDDNTNPSTAGDISTQPVVVQPIYPNQPSYPSPSSNASVHIVQPKEGLYGIGRLYGLNYKDIAAWNNIPPPYILHPGQRLMITPQNSVAPQPSVPVYNPPITPAYNPPAAPMMPDNNSGTYHVVQAGDTLYRIAKIYNTTYQNVAAMNNMFPPYPPLHVGQRLLVAASASTNYNSPNNTYNPAPIQAGMGQEYHVVQAGDTLYRVATLYGRHYLDVAQWNNLSSPFALQVGQRLLVSPPDGSSSYTPSAPKSIQVTSRTVTQTQTHIVLRGESIYDIAARYGKNVRDLARWNAISPPYILEIGQEIRLSAGGDYQAANYQAADYQVAHYAQQMMAVPVKNFHVVKAGETLYSIARRYDLSPQQLAAWSGLAPPYIIRAGQKLLIITY